MTDATTNVVAFAPRKAAAAPPFLHVEIRLRPGCSLQLNAVDERGDVVTFEFTLAAPVAIADVERLLAAWDGWRNSATTAS
jgi:hypothetical protein